MKKKGFEFYLAGAIESKLKEKADELGVNCSVKYTGTTDTSHLKISGNRENFGDFADYASDLILKGELSRTVKFKYA